jgi:hypothetical protein
MHLRILAASCLMSAPAEAQTSLEKALLHVSAQAMAEQAMRSSSWPRAVAPLDLVSEPVRNQGQVTIYSVFRRGAFHFPQYFVAVTDAEHMLLGGFPAPELKRFAQLFCKLVPEREALVGCARELAVYADPIGARAVPLAEASPKMREAWQQNVRPDWPSDSSFARGDYFFVRLNVLSSLELLGSHPAWRPISYVFTFDRGGALVTWTSAQGQGFPIPGEPIRDR